MRRVGATKRDMADANARWGLSASAGRRACLGGRGDGSHARELVPDPVGLRGRWEARPARLLVRVAAPEVRCVCLGLLPFCLRPWGWDTLLGVCGGLMRELIARSPGSSYSRAVHPASHPGPRSLAKPCIRPGSGPVKTDNASVCLCLAQCGTAAPILSTSAGVCIRAFLTLTSASPTGITSRDNPTRVARCAHVGARPPHIARCMRALRIVRRSHCKVRTLCSHALPHSPTQSVLLDDDEIAARSRSRPRLPDRIYTALGADSSSPFFLSPTTISPFPRLTFCFSPCPFNVSPSPTLCASPQSHVSLAVRLHSASVLTSCSARS
ncbi:hypothetical protein PsYK624_043080 [Phanerochaete sordida]|uniref:Uncharacterized protein n=1 Tax=Phanerochaete sordida TaxID=48140 RepID=A0A9P3LAI6_9APHY|nr:hypothetical protein PsYK624_043080 [Phanerochaete sordida]